MKNFNYSNEELMLQHDLLRQAVIMWRLIAYNQKRYYSFRSNPLCKQNYNIVDKCGFCPVFRYTGVVGCANDQHLTTYDYFVDYCIGFDPRITFDWENLQNRIEFINVFDTVSQKLAIKHFELLFEVEKQLSFYLEGNKSCKNTH